MNIIGIRRGAAGFAAILVALCCALAGGSTAGAASPSARLTVESFASPSSFTAGGPCTSADPTEASFAATDCDVYVVTVRNVGSVPTDGSQITLSDVLPAGMTVHRTNFFWSGLLENLGEFLCPGVSECVFPIALAPDQTLEMYLFVTVPAGVTGPLRSTATVSGGGVAEAAASSQTPVGSTPVFGFASFNALMAGSDGEPDTRAGGHPYEFTTTIDMNNERRLAAESQVVHTSVRDPKDIVVDLPVGLAGSALATPQCTFAQLGAGAGCPADTIIGHIVTSPEGLASINSPVYNITPEHGFAAQFGFIDKLNGTHVLSASVVPTPQGYVLRTITTDVPQITLDRIVVRLFGNPVEKNLSGNTPVAFFTNPSACTGEPLVTSVRMDSWQSPGRYTADGTPDFSDLNWAGATSVAPAVTGCNLLQFSPGLSAQPETTVADSPTGLNIDLQVPQSEDPSTLATPPLRDASIVLPAGISLNPSAADGLGSCSVAQIALESPLAPVCPESSKVGTVELQTPLLPGTLGGSVYLAAQEENPFHALVAAYIVVDDPVTGTVLKIPGELKLDPVSGQVTGVFDQAPQFPFSDLRLHFFGGQRGVLATPQACGTYAIGSMLSPWSAPDSGPAASPSDSFQVTSGCVGAFTPGFDAGTVATQAGGFTGFTTTISRGDQDQNLGSVSITTPPGLLGILKSVAQCPEAQASAGSCGQGSLIGHTTVAAGVGAHPFYLGGQMFLTGPYKGAPFGLSIVVPAIAGPFNLGNVVVRARILVDPTTAQLTIVSDALPTILRGIPLALRTVNVTVDRPGFIFNPTSCEPMSVTGTISSTQGAQAQVSSRFQAANCATLPFHPLFSVSSTAKTSRANGAALDVKVSYPQGSQANIHSVAVKLPVQLPARLSTIQQACPAAVFNQNPASCGAGSMIGIGTAITPVFNNSLSGPAYLVSHGGAAFPDIDVVLQGEGVTLDLVGHVNISKAGITSASFFAVPDAPISSFELNLPEGPHSGLSAVGSLCAKPLTMPTTITGQNGAVITQTTKIKVTGCAKAKKKGTKRKARKKRKKTKKGGGKKG